MFKSASNSIAARICVWLAAGMLVFPFVPGPTCGCSGEDSTQQSVCREKTQAGEKRGCCSAPDSRACCGSHQKPLRSCCEHTGSVSEHSCSRGPACKCHLSRHPNPRPTTPVPTQNGTERVKLAPVVCCPAAMPAVEFGPSSVCDEPERFFGATALDRCSTLCRFLC